MLTFTVDSHRVSLTFSPLAVFVLFTFLWTCAEALPAQPQVVGSLQPILAAPGDDVILPCHLVPLTNVEGLTVEWSKPDLKPDPADRLRRVGYVHLYRDRREVLDMKLESYVSRTQLFTDELRRGNISLKVLNVTLADTGRYRCFIPKLNSRVKESIIQLVVDPTHVKMTTTETPQKPRESLTPGPNEEKNLTARSSRNHLIPVMIFCVVLILGVILGGGFLLKHNYRKSKSPMKSAAVPNAG